MTIVTPKIHQLILAAEIARLDLLRVVEHETAERLRQAREQTEQTPTSASLSSMTWPSCPTGWPAARPSRSVAGVIEEGKLE